MSLRQLQSNPTRRSSSGVRPWAYGNAGSMIPLARGTLPSVSTFSQPTVLGSPHVAPAVAPNASMYEERVGLSSPQFGPVMQQMDYLVQGAQYPAEPPNPFAMPAPPEGSQPAGGWWGEDGTLLWRGHMPQGGAFPASDASPDHDSRPPSVYAAGYSANTSPNRTYTASDYSHQSLAVRQPGPAHVQPPPAFSSITHFPFLPPTHCQSAALASTLLSAPGPSSFASFSQLPSPDCNAPKPSVWVPNSDRHVQLQSTPCTPAMIPDPSIAGPSRNARASRPAHLYSPYLAPILGFAALHISSPSSMVPSSASASTAFPDAAPPSTILPTPTLDYHPCEWREENGSQCGILLEDLKTGGISRHLQDYHDIDRQSRKLSKCRWGDCHGKCVQEASMGKHVATTHLRLKNQVACDHCNISFGREDAYLRHLRNQHSLKATRRLKAEK